MKIIANFGIGAANFVAASYTIFLGLKNKIDVIIIGKSKVYIFYKNLKIKTKIQGFKKKI